MPRISEFFGIVVYMYWFDVKRHKSPHIHVKFQNQWSVFDLEGNLLEGPISSRASRLTKEFIAERNEELNDAWKKAIEGEDLPWIKPIY